MLVAPASGYAHAPVLSDPVGTFELSSKELDSHTKLCSNKVTKSASHLYPPRVTGSGVRRSVGKRAA